MSDGTVLLPEEPAAARALRLPAGHATLRGHVAIMRIDHWVKQVFVLPGIVAALSNGTGDIPGGLLGRLVLGFAAVNLVSSSNYVINEVLDAPSDLSHPVMRRIWYRLPREGGCTSQ